MTDCILQCQWRSRLLDRGKTSVGTLPSNRKEIPAEIREIKDRETNLYEIYFICAIGHRGNSRYKKILVILVLNSKVGPPGNMGT